MTELNFYAREISSSGPLQLYVRDADGLDTNDGLSDVLPPYVNGVGPLKTLQAAYNKIALLGADQASIELGDHTGLGYKADLPFKLIDTPIGIWGSGAGVGDGFTDIIASTAAGAGTTASVVKSAALGVNALRGKTILCQTDGGTRTERRSVLSNTATDILLSAALDGAFGAGDLYRVVTASVRIDVTPSAPGGITPFANCYMPRVGRDVSSTGPLSTGALPPSISLAQVKLTSYTDCFLIFASGTWFHYGVEVDDQGNNLRVIGNDCDIAMGADDAIGTAATIPVVLFGQGSDQDWLGWGLQKSDAVGVSRIGEGQNAAWTGYIVAPLISSSYSVRWFVGGNVFGRAGQTSVFISEGGFVFFFLATGSAIGADKLFDVARKGILETVACSLSSAAGAMFRCRDDGFVQDQFSTGASATGFTVDAHEGGRFTVVGATSLGRAAPDTDWTVGNGTDFDNSALAAVGDSQSYYIAGVNTNPDGSVVQRVVF